MTEEWVTVGEAAEYFKVHSRTTWRLLKSGKLPSYRLQRLIRLKRSDLDKLLETNRRGANLLELAEQDREERSRHEAR